MSSEKTHFASCTPSLGHAGHFFAGLIRKLNGNRFPTTTQPIPLFHTVIVASKFHSREKNSSPFSAYYRPFLSRRPSRLFLGLIVPPGRCSVVGFNRSAPFHGGPVRDIGTPRWTNGVATWNHIVQNSVLGPGAMSHECNKRPNCACSTRFAVPASIKSATTNAAAYGCARSNELDEMGPSIRDVRISTGNSRRAGTQATYPYRSFEACGSASARNTQV